MAGLADLLRNVKYAMHQRRTISPHLPGIPNQENTP